MSQSLEHSSQALNSLGKFFDDSEFLEKIGGSPELITNRNDLLVGLNKAKNSEEKQKAIDDANNFINEITERIAERQIDFDDKSAAIQARLNIDVARANFHNALNDDPAAIAARFKETYERYENVQKIDGYVSQQGQKIVLDAYDQKKSFTDVVQDAEEEITPFLKGDRANTFLTTNSNILPSLLNQQINIVFDQKAVDVFKAYDNFQSPYKEAIFANINNIKTNIDEKKNAMSKLTMLDYAADEKSATHREIQKFHTVYDKISNQGNSDQKKAAKDLLEIVDQSIREYSVVENTKFPGFIEEIKNIAEGTEEVEKKALLTEVKGLAKGLYDESKIIASYLNLSAEDMKKYLEGPKGLRQKSIEYRKSESEVAQKESTITNWIAARANDLDWKEHPDFIAMQFKLQKVQSSFRDPNKDYTRDGFYSANKYNAALENILKSKDKISSPDKMYEEKGKELMKNIDSIISGSRVPLKLEYEDFAVFSEYYKELFRKEYIKLGLNSRQQEKLKSMLKESSHGSKTVKGLQEKHNKFIERQIGHTEKQISEAKSSKWKEFFPEGWQEDPSFDIEKAVSHLAMRFVDSNLLPELQKKYDRRIQAAIAAKVKQLSEGVDGLDEKFKAMDEKLNAVYAVNPKHLLKDEPVTEKEWDEYWINQMRAEYPKLKFTDKQKEAYKKEHAAKWTTRRNEKYKNYLNKYKQRDLEREVQYQAMSDQVDSVLSQRVTEKKFQNKEEFYSYYAGNIRPLYDNVFGEDKKAASIFKKRNIPMVKVRLAKKYKGFLEGNIKTTQDKIGKITLTEQQKQDSNFDIGRYVQIQSDTILNQNMEYEHHSKFDKDISAQTLILSQAQNADSLNSLNDIKKIADSILVENPARFLGQKPVSKQVFDSYFLQKLNPTIQKSPLTLQHQAKLMQLYTKQVDAKYQRYQNKFEKFGQEKESIQNSAFAFTIENQDKVKSFPEYKKLFAQQYPHLSLPQHQKFLSGVLFDRYQNFENYKLNKAKEQQSIAQEIEITGVEKKNAPTGAERSLKLSFSTFSVAIDTVDSFDEYKQSFLGDPSNFALKDQVGERVFLSLALDRYKNFVNYKKKHTSEKALLVKHMYSFETEKATSFSDYKEQFERAHDSPVTKGNRKFFTDELRGRYSDFKQYKKNEIGESTSLNVANEQVSPELYSELYSYTVSIDAVRSFQSYVSVFKSDVQRKQLLETVSKTKQKSLLADRYDEYTLYRKEYITQSTQIDAALYEFAVTSDQEKAQAQTLTGYTKLFKKNYPQLDVDKHAVAFNSSIVNRHKDFLLYQKQEVVAAKNFLPHEEIINEEGVSLKYISQLEGRYSSAKIEQAMQWSKNLQQYSGIKQLFNSGDHFETMMVAFLCEIDNESQFQKISRLAQRHSDPKQLLEAMLVDESLSAERQHVWGLEAKFPVLWNKVKIDVQGLGVRSIQEIKQAELLVENEEVLEVIDDGDLEFDEVYEEDQEEEIEELESTDDMSNQSIDVDEEIEENEEEGVEAPEKKFKVDELENEEEAELVNILHDESVEEQLLVSEEDGEEEGEATEDEFQEEVSENNEETEEIEDVITEENSELQKDIEIDEKEEEEAIDGEAITDDVVEVSASFESNEITNLVVPEFEIPDIEDTELIGLETVETATVTEQASEGVEDKEGVEIDLGAKKNEEVFAATSPLQETKIEVEDIIAEEMLLEEKEKQEELEKSENLKTQEAERVALAEKKEQDDLLKEELIQADTEFEGVLSDALETEEDELKGNHVLDESKLEEAFESNEKTEMNSIDIEDGNSAIEGESISDEEVEYITAQLKHSEFVEFKDLGPKEKITYLADSGIEEIDGEAEKESFMTVVQEIDRRLIALNLESYLEEDMPLESFQEEVMQEIAMEELMDNPEYFNMQMYMKEYAGVRLKKAFEKLNTNVETASNASEQESEAENVEVEENGDEEIEDVEAKNILPDENAETASNASQEENVENVETALNASQEEEIEEQEKQQQQVEQVQFSIHQLLEEQKHIDAQEKTEVQKAVMLQNEQKMTDILFRCLDGEEGIEYLSVADAGVGALLRAFFQSPSKAMLRKLLSMIGDNPELKMILMQALADFAAKEEHRALDKLSDCIPLSMADTLSLREIVENIIAFAQILQPQLQGISMQLSKSELDMQVTQAPKVVRKFLVFLQEEWKQGAFASVSFSLQGMRLVGTLQTKQGMSSHIERLSTL